MCVSITKLCSGGCPGDLDAARCTCDSNYFFRCESIVDDVEIVKCVPNALKCDESFNCPNVDCNSKCITRATLCVYTRRIKCIDITAIQGKERS